MKLVTVNNVSLLYLFNVDNRIEHKFKTEIWLYHIHSQRSPMYRWSEQRQLKELLIGANEHSPVWQGFSRESVKHLLRTAKQIQSKYNDHSLAIHANPIVTEYQPHTCYVSNHVYSMQRGTKRHASGY